MHKLKKRSSTALPSPRLGCTDHASSDVAGVVPRVHEQHAHPRVEDRLGSRTRWFTVSVRIVSDSEGAKLGSRLELASGSMDLEEVAGGNFFVERVPQIPSQNCV